MTLRTQLFFAFVATRLPTPPARVLEVGCGKGALALLLAEAGYDVTAIDPDAPDGPIFRRAAIEDFSDSEGFDAVVASLSLHHVGDLPGALDTIESLLRPAGAVVVEEFARERLVGSTARWYYEQRQALTRTESAESVVPADLAAWEREERAHLADLHAAETILTELSRRFETQHVEWRPYLYSWQLDDTLEPVERELIGEQAIEATGLWYTGAAP